MEKYQKPTLNAYSFGFVEINRLRDCKYLLLKIQTWISVVEYDLFISVYFRSLFILPKYYTWSSICIQLLLFHNNQKNVYPHSFLVTLEFLELSCAKASKRHQKSRWEFYLENTNSISVDDHQKPRK